MRITGVWAAATTTPKIQEASSFCSVKAIWNNLTLQALTQTRRVPAIHSIHAGPGSKRQIGMAGRKYVGAAGEILVASLVGIHPAVGFRQQGIGADITIGGQKYNGANAGG
jgi:hypothetical protein